MGRRRETLPSDASVRLAAIAKRLRASPMAAQDEIGRMVADGALRAGDDTYPFTSGWFKAAIEGAAADIEQVLAMYASPAKSRTP